MIDFFSAIWLSILWLRITPLTVCHFPLIAISHKNGDFELWKKFGYEDFKQVYKCVMHGVDFNPIINSDIVKYYKDVNYKINQMGYNGILIIFDEFSKFLEYVGNENIMRDLKIIQDFAEVASRTGKSEQILFTCITHKTINEYMKI